jgi:tetratricopeptide (TPR) repeat protein
VRFSPDGKTILTGGDVKTARLWDAATGQPIGRPLEHQGAVSAESFSPDGTTILTGSSDKTARLWDATTGQPVGKPLEHRDEVHAVAFSPDGKTILTGGDDKTAQLWDAATGRPIGRPLEHQDSVWAVSFSPDGTTIVTGSLDGTAQLWDTATSQAIGSPLEVYRMAGSVAFSPDGTTLLIGSVDGTARLWAAPAQLPEDVPRLAAWVETLTGQELDERGSVRPLDSAAWQERREELRRLGGPPAMPTVPWLDPILFGSDPSARGDSLVKLARWDQAEAAYAEALQARPLHRSVWSARGRFYTLRARPEQAAANYAEAIRNDPDDLGLREQQCLVWLAAGDRGAVKRTLSELMDRWSSKAQGLLADHVARICTLAPDAVVDVETPVRLAQSALGHRSAGSMKAEFLNTLGAALYRAGRFEEAISRFRDALQSGFEARRLLDQLQNRQPSEDLSRFWIELEIRLLRSEAEAVVLHDPVFPADLFAR